MTKSNKVLKVLAVALVATNIIAASAALHYKRAAKENLQDFWQASAEFDRLKSEWDQDLKESCKDAVLDAIQKTGDETLEVCEAKIDEIQHNQLKACDVAQTKEIYEEARKGFAFELDNLRRENQLLQKKQPQAVLELQGDLETCEDMISDLQSELSEQAATLRYLQPNLFTGAQAASYLIHIAFDSMTQEEAEFAADQAEGSQI